MHFILLDANPIIVAGGQIAAIILCIFLLITVILTLAINLGLAFALAWIREKVNLIKLLRPTVNSVNKSSEAALQGESPSTTEDKIGHAVAILPGGVHTIDQKVGQGSAKVANAVIEFRARTVQAQTIVKAFLTPDQNAHKVRSYSSNGRLSAKNADFSQITGPEVSTMDKVTTSDGSRQAIPASQEQHVTAR